jgi:hypothetical protein
LKLSHCGRDSKHLDKT